MRCEFCGRSPLDGAPCMSTQDMLDGRNPIGCYAALIFAGGGERVEDQAFSVGLMRPLLAKIAMLERRNSELVAELREKMTEDEAKGALK